MTDEVLADLSKRLKVLEYERGARRLLERYGHSLDYGDEHGFLDCFMPHGTYAVRTSDVPTEAAALFPQAIINESGIIFRGREALRPFAAVHSRAPDFWHKHLVADSVLNIDCEVGEGRIVSYFLRLDATERGREITAFGRYVDRVMLCDDGKWRFTDRVVELESNALEPGQNAPDEV